MPAATPPQPAQSLKPVTYSEYPRYPKLEELIATLHRLRAPGGCVWDSEQTHETLVQYLIEETHELIEAIETGTQQAAPCRNSDPNIVSKIMQGVFGGSKRYGDRRAVPARAGPGGRDPDRPVEKADPSARRGDRDPALR